jgi:hypothetical protein
MQPVLDYEPRRPHFSRRKLIIIIACVLFLLLVTAGAVFARSQHIGKPVWCDGSAPFGQDFGR